MEQWHIYYEMIINVFIYLKILLTYSLFIVCLLLLSSRVIYQRMYIYIILKILFHYDLS